jgi:hypothetical protein
MKKIISLVVAVTCYTTIQAQYLAEAIKYSQNFPTLTARSLAMGGAFTSLGGDFASTSLNPAGLGLYRKSEFVFSPSLNYSLAESNYYGVSSNSGYSDIDNFGDLNEDVKYQFNISNLGYVGTYLSGKDQGLVSASYAIGYNRLNNFNRTFSVSGINDSTSLVDAFFYDDMSDDANGSDINGTPPEDLNPFGSGVAFETFLIDTIPGSFDYDTPVLLPVDQRRTVDSRGGTGQYTFGFGLNFSNIWYVGMNLGIYHISYEGTTRHTEYDATNATDFNNFTYTEDLDVEGNGFGLSMGTMVRIFKIMRLGATLHLPTFYKIEEVYRTSIVSEFDNDNFEFSSEGNFVYRLSTPLRLQGGASVQLGKAGILAADIEYINYSGMLLREQRGDSEDVFSNSNDDIDNVFRPVVNLKLGGEARLLENLFVRAGGGFYPSPYTSDELNSDASYLELTGGLGYRSSSFFVDFGFSSLFHEEKYNAYSAYNYRAPNNYVNNLADVDQMKFRFVISTGFRF